MNIYNKIKRRIYERKLKQIEKYHAALFEWAADNLHESGFDLYKYVRQLESDAKTKLSQKYGF